MFQTITDWLKGEYALDVLADMLALNPNPDKH